MEDLVQRLLVVEDDVTVARAVSRTLARRGFSVALARSCTAAQALLQTFDFAVLDLDLPDGNGVDLARALLDGDKVRCVLFFTGSRDPAMLSRARGLGSVIMKSSGIAEVLTQLTQLVAESVEPPQSRTAKSDKTRAFATASAVSKSQAR